MNKLTRKEQFNLLFKLWYKMDSLYSEYAKREGMSYTTMLILNIIYEDNNHCTQKMLAEKTFLPKQTINTVITGFYKNGLITLKEVPDDRRNKTIELTPQGQELADKIFPSLDNAAMNALEAIEKTEVSKLLELLQTYVDNFEKNIK